MPINKRINVHFIVCYRTRNLYKKGFSDSVKNCYLWALTDSNLKISHELSFKR